MEPRDKMPWKRLYPKQSDDEIHLLDKLLELNPQKRLSVDEVCIACTLSLNAVHQALQHPYFNDWRTPLSSHHDEHDCEGALLDDGINNDLSYIYDRAVWVRHRRFEHRRN